MRCMKWLEICRSMKLRYRFRRSQNELLFTTKQPPPTVVVQVGEYLAVAVEAVAHGAQPRGLTAASSRYERSASMAVSMFAMSAPPQTRPLVEPLGLPERVVLAQLPDPRKTTETRYGYDAATKGTARGLNGYAC